MNLVHAAMRRPVTVLVIVLAVCLGAGLALKQMQRDIFPDLGIPVIYVAQPYGGMDPAQMEGYLVNYYEYHFLYINGIEHVESKSIQGTGLIKLQFHPGTNMAQAMAETISYVNRSRAFMPPGTVPPFVMQFGAGSVPVGNLVFSTDNPKRTVGEMQDLALMKVRPLFATLPGVSAPPPFGGSQRTIVVRVDPDRLRAYGMTPDEVVTAISGANTIAPSGNVRIGDLMPMIPSNAIASNVKDLENVPLRSSGTTSAVFVRDVGTVEDASDIPTGYALVNGKRTVFIPVTKRADASTLAVVDLVKQNLGKFQAVLPDDVKVSYQFDQSPYVTRAINGLAMEGLLGAVLTGIMVLLFLRDWRSAMIIVLNIPISLMAAVLALWVSKETINIMTLGGLALAVGVLVDEATVTIENIHTHLARGTPLARAAMVATHETAVPRLLAMLCILAVFIPALFMKGAARGLFVPLSLAVGFTMVASYLLSSTLVPVLSVWVLRSRHHHHEEGNGEPRPPAGFDRARAAYAAVARRAVALRWTLVPLYLLVAIGAVWFIGRGLGQEIFPVVDAGQFQLRMRGPTGTRIEKTEQTYLTALNEVKKEVGEQNVALSMGFVGVQPAAYPVNTIHLWTGGPEEGVMQVQLKSDAKIAIGPLKERLRKRLAQAIPGVTVSFEPSDIVSRVMSFGSPTPVEITVGGPSLDANREYANKLRSAIAGIDSLRDVQFLQAADYPTLEVNVDRQRAGALGLTANDIMKSVVTSTWSSRFVVPNYWADPKSGVAYQVQVELPQSAMKSVSDLENLPVARRDSGPILLKNLASVTPGTRPEQFSRYNMQRLITLTANVQGEDLGSIAGKVSQAIAQLPPPPRVTPTIRGQIPTLFELLGGLQTGLLLAIAVIFLLLAANFQSWKLAIVVISTVPAVIAGVVIALWLTRTTLNIQSFMGAIMAVGVAVANAILLVTFAERRRLDGVGARVGAVDGAAGRLRPILMTSFAMIAGMIPMAMGTGEGGEQTAPLGRAVVGGLVAATLATLLVLPAVFALVQGRAHTRSASLDPDDPTSSQFAPESTPAVGLARGTHEVAP